ncbi:MAG: Leucine--tRNA ligase [Rhodocyclaceae bacterium]|nr:Leucine--tRNA ligase [Rhodocyclaceae bacterium]
MESSDHSQHAPRRDSAKYDPIRIEQAAQRHWDTSGTFRAREAKDRPKYYCLSMFPYPSGKLHMGHVRNYTIGDVLARHYRMKGHDVLQPMGWDAFGLPAENAAMANGVPPARWTYDNIAYMRKQLKALGFAIDWERELATCEPTYYKWNQWLFLRMLERGLAYKKSGTVNWDPVDQTVLANEQVIEGRGWRTGAPVEKRDIPMYYLAITRYAEELLADLDKLPGWPERVKTMQANWIGKSFGVRFAFPYELDGQSDRLWVFTTRADTIMGVTFCALAAEHPLAERAARDNPSLSAFIEECKHGSVMEADLATMEKKGMPTGFSVRHPLTGETIPVWVANYVLMSYGDGAVMAVPAHDERDFHFARSHQLPIKPVIAIDGVPFSDQVWQDEYADKLHGRCVNSGKYDGLAFAEAVDAVAKDLEALGLGEKRVQWRLRDWGISRQRYWGCPIPIIHCPKCGDVPVPEKDLPVVLPEDCVPDGSGNPLAKRADFVHCACPKCGQAARRETDTMDTFVDSSWYYARYACPDLAAAMVDWRAQHWLPVDQYIGGIEHAILHLLYSRFWTKVMRDLGLVTCSEPFTRLLTQGMVLNHIFSRRNARGGNEYFSPDEVDLTHDAHGKITGAVARSDGRPVLYEGVGTMSKSKRNGVDPQALIDRYGADTARFFMIFASHPEQTLEWSDSGVDGAHRFLKRLWAYGLRHVELATLAVAPETSADRSARRELHKLLKQANYDFERVQFNTVAAACMKMLNLLEEHPHTLETRPFTDEALSILLRLLSPICPHVCHELWRLAGFGEDIVDAPWPLHDDSALLADEIELVLQINGKLRGSLRVSANADRASIEACALASDPAQRHLAGRAPKKVIVVPGRLVNVVA